MRGEGPELTPPAPPARPALGVQGNMLFRGRGDSHTCLYYAHAWHPAFFTSQHVVRMSLHEYSVIFLVLGCAALRGWARPALLGWMPGRLPTLSIIDNAAVYHLVWAPFHTRAGQSAGSISGSGTAVSRGQCTCNLDRYCQMPYSLGCKTLPPATNVL